VEGLTLRSHLVKLRALANGRVLAVGMLLLAVRLCPAQRFSFRDVSEHLGNLTVNCLAQDHTGYLWVGTENGLFRYDGTGYRPYGAPDGMTARAVHSLFVGQDGTLWVGTNAGVFFQRHNGSFAEVGAPVPFGRFISRMGSIFTAEAADRVAMADRGGVVLLRRQGEDAWTAEDLHLAEKEVWSVLYDSGVLWYGCDSDLCRLQDGKTIRMHTPPDRWTRLLMARDGHLWMRGAAHLAELAPQDYRLTLRDPPGPSNDSPYSSLLEDPQGRVLTTQGPAFGIWTNGRWRLVDKENGLSGFDLSTLFLDREGSLWIASIGHGLEQWVGAEHWEAYTTANGLANDTVWGSLRDRRGRLWVGTEAGLNWLAGDGPLVHAWNAPGIETARTTALALSSDGNIWFGSPDASLVRIDPNSLGATRWNLKQIHRILEDRKHRLWIATEAGLYRADLGGPRPAPRLVTDAAIADPRQRFRDLCLDSDDRLWAVAEQGLLRLDESGWRRIDPGLSGVHPSFIAADGRGNLWAAGAFSGVMRLRVAEDGVQEAQHFVKPLLLSDQVVSLLVDHRGWLWVGQDAGLTVFDGKSWRSFTQDDGLVWNDLDSFGLTEDRDGSLWIGTSGGLSHLLKPEAANDGAPPAPIFSQVTFGSNEIANHGRIPWSRAAMTIAMASLGFRNAHAVQIRYRLMGEDSEWLDTPGRTVRYPRLSPGTYRFEAYAVDTANGAISPSAAFEFQILPRWWQSRPMWIGLSLLALLSAVLFAPRWLRMKKAVPVKLENATRIRIEALEREKLEMLRSREQFRYLAEHDDLTGLWNHRVILERLRIEVERSRRDRLPLSIVMVDLDHFKQVNDQHGHPAGDHVLRVVGSIFLNSIRSYDWVGRYGGEEFLIVLPSSNFSGVRERTEQLRVALQDANITFNGTQITVTASFGVASGFPSSYEAMILAADAALYRAKDNGRNCSIAVEIEPQEETKMKRG
jgi:diguanylate cyclase (GGDEF)-like protein